MVGVFSRREPRGHADEGQVREYVKKNDESCVQQQQQRGEDDGSDEKEAAWNEAMTKELYDKYQRYMVDTMMHDEGRAVVLSHENQNLHQAIVRPEKDCGSAASAHRARTCHGGRAGKAKRSTAPKATGVTLRHAQEMEIAKENMFIFQRLQRIKPSREVDRRMHEKDFVKSRQYLEKMSRYDYRSGPLSLVTAVWID